MFEGRNHQDYSPCWNFQWKWECELEWECRRIQPGNITHTCEKNSIPCTSTSPACHGGWCCRLPSWTPSTQQDEISGSATACLPLRHINRDTLDRLEPKRIQVLDKSQNSPPPRCCCLQSIKQPIGLHIHTICSLLHSNTIITWKNHWI